MTSPRRLGRVVGVLLPLAAAVAGCATTTVTVQPSPQPPVCSASASAWVLWWPRWRPDQKDVADREAAAAAGLSDFFAESRCFARAEVQRAARPGAPAVALGPATANGTVSKVIGIEVRELGPVVRLLSSAALVEGGTEVVLGITEFAPESGATMREFTVHWHNGGAGVVKGVSSLPADMQSALRAGLQPAVGAR